MDKLANGTRVIKSGYPGTVVCEYLPGMYEVRLASGVVVVPRDELTLPWHGHNGRRGHEI